MEPDFSGWATKAGLKCTDGRTIMAGAFQHQDKEQVPLVWQHGHDDPENVLGHVLLENRADGVWCNGFFNKTAKATHAHELLEHKDINSLSIWANQLVERSKRVLHGAIKEVSLVLSGANPGAKIQNVTLRHADGSEDETLDDEAIIFSGELLAGFEGEKKDDVTHANKPATTDETPEDIYNTMNEKQQKVCDWLVSQAMAGAMAQSDLDLKDDEAFSKVYDSMDDSQKKLLHSMLSAAKGNADSAKHDNVDDKNKKGDEVGTEVKHQNIFEKKEEDEASKKHERVFLSHDDIKGIVEDATGTTKSLKASVQAYALAHGINDIDILFPDAKNLTDTPEFISRRVEWVQKLLAGVRKSPFSRIKTLQADITVQEARAKGYIKGTLKKEEFFGIAKRITTPTTIYKKQQLDRDDIIDITDFDVVAWLKGEMRLMLDEEVARAILLGDGRAVDDPDKVNEGNIRPIATDHEVYVTTLNVPIDATPATISNAIDQMALHRSELRGSGSPTFWTTERWLARMLLLKDTTGRKLYRNVDELKSDLRVSDVVTVEVMEEYPDLFGILVNPTDYVAGADKGGAVSMFDDFDIDYNQYKYLIETRMSGALVKYKCAMVVRTVAGNAVAVAPAAPVFDGDSVNIVNTPNVVYRNQDTDAVMNAAGSPYAVAPDTTINIHAEPASAGFYIPDENTADWAFRNNG